MNIFVNAKFDFIGKFKLFGIISTAAVLISLVIFFARGLNYGVDFAGGTEIQVKVDGLKTEELRKYASEFGSVDIQEFEGRDYEFLIRFLNVSMVDDNTINSYIESVKNEFPESKLTKKHFDSQVGDRIEMWFENPVDEAKLKSLTEKFKIPATGTIEYKKVGDRHIYKVLLEGITTEILSTIKEKSGKEPELMRVELVGPKVGQKLRYSALQAILYSLIAILIYIAFRFNFQFAPGAVISLAHDVMITMGIWALFRLQFDLTIVAALLTIVGYSLNDTIVIYDRIRENANNSKKGSTAAEKMNTSINETLSRTILTSFTTLIALFALLFFGGETISGFALAMSFGILIGTYSSIFIASPVTLLVEKYMDKEKTT